jgi:hypothetical protein
MPQNIVLGRHIDASSAEQGLSLLCGLIFCKHTQDGSPQRLLLRRVAVLDLRISTVCTYIPATKQAGYKRQASTCSDQHETSRVYITSH